MLELLSCKLFEKGKEGGRNKKSDKEKKMEKNDEKLKKKKLKNFWEKSGEKRRVVEGRMEKEK